MEKNAASNSTAQATTPVRVNTYHFESAHGRKPRGSGHWAFSFVGNDPKASEILWVQGTYTVAKKAAVAEAKRRGFWEVLVLS